MLDQLASKRSPENFMVPLSLPNVKLPPPSASIWPEKVLCPQGVRTSPMIEEPATSTRITDAPLQGSGCGGISAIHFPSNGPASAGSGSHARPAATRIAQNRMPHLPNQPGHSAGFNSLEHKHCRL